MSDPPVRLGYDRRVLTAKVQVDARDLVMMLDAEWREEALMDRLAEWTRLRNACDRSLAWRRWGRRGKAFVDNTDTSKLFRHSEDARAWLRHRSERRVHLLIRIFNREEEAYKRARTRLLVGVVPQVGARWLVVASVSSTDFHTQGHGAEFYAQGKADMIADRLLAAGIPVVVCRATYHRRLWPGHSPALEFVVNARCERIDFQAAQLRESGDLAEQVRRCWARGVNPRVFNPWLPPGFEEQHGITYQGGRA